jgi:hypothetical protein
MVAIVAIVAMDGYGWLWLVEMDRLCGGSLARIICAAGGNEPRDKW